MSFEYPEYIPTTTVLTRGRNAQLKDSLGQEWVRVSYHNADRDENSDPADCCDSCGWEIDGMGFACLDQNGDLCYDCVEVMPVMP